MSMMMIHQVCDGSCFSFRDEGRLVSSDVASSWYHIRSTAGFLIHGNMTRYCVRCHNNDIIVLKDAEHHLHQATACSIIIMMNKHVPLTQNFEEEKMLNHTARCGGP